jgi:hypothetical protein
MTGGWRPVSDGGHRQLSGTQFELWNYMSHETLDKRDRTGGGFAAFDVRLFDQKSGDDAMNDLQYRRQQFGMHGE